VKRREFITVIGGAAATWPIAARTQQSTRPLVALINGGAADALARYAAAFRKGLSEMGYDEEKNVTVEYHWLEGQYALLPDLLDNLMRRRVAVIATPGSNPASLAAKAATATIPIVFGVGEDPVALGLIANLAKPRWQRNRDQFFRARGER
jgi:putative ABC transport system substrate-binding protein